MDNFPATKEYDRAVRIADEVLSEQHVTTLKTSAVGREYADAMRAELLRAIAERDDEIRKISWMLHHAPQLDLRELSDEYDMREEVPDA